MTSYQFLLIFHIAFTAVWFGGSLSNAGRLRRGLALGGAEAKFSVDETARAMKISTIFGVLTFASGLALILNMGGFDRVGKNIHASMGIVLVMLLLDVTLIRCAFGKLAAIVRSGGDLSGTACYKKKLAMLGGIKQLLWLIVLGLMVIKSF